MMAERLRLFSALLDPLTMSETVARICAAVSERRPLQHVVINVAKLVSMSHDAELAASVNACDIINADGKGVVWGARFLGLDVPERVAGIDLMIELFGEAERRGFRPFLLGARAEVLDEAVRRVGLQFPKLQLAGHHHGYFWDEEEAMVERIAASGADMLFVAISSPKKENFLNRHGPQMGVPFTMGVGGSFDVLAGRVRRAPVWMQKTGLEWLVRLLQEPRRMWRRYLLTNARFGWMLLVAKIRGSHDSKV
jgi:N-acetylglucosaminyldiphosphoundecaprenol N-acetyl-beta-D-mannosaminyltransferase